MSNQFFKLNRFGLYFRLQVKLLGKGYLLAYLAAFILALLVGIILVSIGISEDASRPFQEEFQILVLFGLGLISILIGTWMFARLNKPESIMGFLAVPASHFEKTLTAFILSFIAPATLCLTIFLVTEQAMFGYFRVFADPFNTGDIESYLNLERLEDMYYGKTLWWHLIQEKDAKFIVSMVISIYLAIHSFYVMGSLAFRRFSFVFTSLSLGLTIFISVALVVLLALGIIKPELLLYLDYYIDDLSVDWFGEEARNSNESLILYFIPCLFLLTAGVLWVATYLKLKEKEVR